MNPRIAVRSPLRWLCSWRGQHGARFWLAVAVVSGLAIGAIVRSAGVYPLKVVTHSMAPVADQEDWVVVRELDEAGRRGLRRDDIVLIRFPLGTSGRAIKRIVALGGDTVAIAEQSVTVNGRVIPIDGAPSEEAARRRLETVPAEHVFLLGDNAAVSIDSRSFGPVADIEIVGKEMLVIDASLWTLAGPAVAVIVGTLVLVGIVMGRRRDLR